MSDSQNWRIEDDAESYFQHQRKQLQVADRRPVPRKASDLGLGPGLGSAAVRITDYNDLLATFNGYYSSAVGAANAPNATETFIGQAVSDAEFGGQQVFTGLTSGIEYRRSFARSPIDPEAIAWTPWIGPLRIRPTVDAYTEVDTPVLAGSSALLHPPTVVTMVGQAAEHYEFNDSGVKILKSGVYSGSIQIGDRAGSTVLSSMALYRPSGSTTIGQVQLTVPLAPTVHIPFTVIALDGEQGFSMTAQHGHSDTRSVWWRMSITRVGDAL